jgi:hypothetical protein
MIIAIALIYHRLRDTFPDICIVELNSVGFSIDILAV